MHEVALGILFTVYYIFLFFLSSIDSDCILHGYIKKLGGPFASARQTRYARLYPNRLELHYESSSTKPELVLMDHIEEINSELTTFKGEQSILLRTKEGGRVVLTNQVIIPLYLFFPSTWLLIYFFFDGSALQDEIGLKEWLLSLRSAHKGSLELLANMARKAGKIYGTDLDSNNRQLTHHHHHSSPMASRSSNGT